MPSGFNGKNRKVQQHIRSAPALEFKLVFVRLKAVHNDEHNFLFRAVSHSVIWMVSLLSLFRITCLGSITPLLPPNLS